MDNMKHGGGVIVNVSSLSGEKEKNHKKYQAYVVL